jgi:hypothetical protein
MYIPGLDSQQSAFLLKQLEHIKAKVLTKKFAPLKFLQPGGIQVSFEAPEGADRITQRIYTSLGLAKIIASNARDLPRVNLVASEDTIRTKILGDSYAYTYDDLAAAMMAGVDLTSKDAEAARMAIDMAMDNIALFGAPAAGLYGLLTHPNFTKFEAGNGSWAVASDAQDLLDDLNEIANTPMIVSNDVEGNGPQTLFLPIDQYTIIATKRMSTIDSTTVLNTFKQMHPQITVDRAAKLAAVPINPRTLAASPTDVAVLIPQDADKVRFEVTKPFTQTPPQAHGLEFEVPCYAKIGGVMSSYPLSAVVVDGL